MSMPDSLLVELHYLPSIEYFCCLKSHDHIVIETQEHFQKQTYRNRCVIRSANKVDTLSIPIKGGNGKVPIKNVQIDYSQKWNDNHWRAIQSAYGKAPFFEFFADYFYQEFRKKEKFLFDHNYSLLTTCLKLLNLDLNITFSEIYQKDVSGDIRDIRSQIHPKKQYTARQYYRPIPYTQIFGKDFVPNLSIIDLLMCEGPNSADFVRKSTYFK